VIDRAPAERARILDEAQRLALGFLHWLQTEAPHDDGKGQGFPGLRLLPEVMGTQNGLSKAPYIRESRRILALTRVVESDIVVASPPDAVGRGAARAKSFEDSVGVGWYAMDLHDCVGAPTSMFAPTLPFQIPLGALIPRRVTNMLAACKNIGTTHLTNGSYRLHPVEWNIGESAGTLAAFCCDQGCDPRQVWEAAQLRQGLQYRLLARGIPVAWTLDLPSSDPLFALAQMLVVSGAIPASGPRSESLKLQVDRSLCKSERACLEKAASALGLCGAGELAVGRTADPITWRAVCVSVADAMRARFSQYL
jgi:hypothetical protein